jgi:hypothetical protein
VIFPSRQKELSKTSNFFLKDFVFRKTIFTFAAVMTRISTHTDSEKLPNNAKYSAVADIFLIRKLYILTNGLGLLCASAWRAISFLQGGRERLFDNFQTTSGVGGLCSLAYKENNKIMGCKSSISYILKILNLRPVIFYNYINVE